MSVDSLRVNFHSRRVNVGSRRVSFHSQRVNGLSPRVSVDSLRATVGSQRVKVGSLGMKIGSLSVDTHTRRPDSRSIKGAVVAHGRGLAPLSLTVERAEDYAPPRLRADAVSGLIIT